MTSPQARRPEPAPASDSREAAPAAGIPAAVPTAVQSATKVATRISDDEAAADAERARLAQEPLPRITDRTEEGTLLEADEILHAIRHAALVEDRGARFPEGGTLYLTSRRLIHASENGRRIQLEAIVETSVVLERLLLVSLVDGSDLAIEVDQPRLLQVQLSAARAAARESDLSMSHEASDRLLDQTSA